MHQIHVLSISAQSTRNQTKKVHKMSIQSLRHIHLSLCRTINLCVISEESNSKKFTNVNTISAAYTSISAPYYQSLHNLPGIKLKKVYKMSIQSLRHIHLSLLRIINLCAISEESNLKNFTKCQYNLCGIYIYLCSVLSISAQSPRN